jgi:MAF protein
MLEDYKIILASQSPRRKELLRGINLPFEVRTIEGLEEHYPSTLVGEEIPLFLARQKADAYRSLIESNEMIITADTIVWLNSEVMGKPHNKQEAIDMLHKLSGNTHDVITGVCITTKERQQSFSTHTLVTFATLSDEEISYYIDTYLPLDKAGSYGIQEWIGYVGVEKLEGSYFNVVGLPIQKLYQTLKHWND